MMENGFYTHGNTHPSFLLETRPTFNKETNGTSGKVKESTSSHQLSCHHPLKWDTVGGRGWGARSTQLSRPVVDVYVLQQP